MNQRDREVVIVGGGPAGSFAALAAARAGAQVTVIERNNCLGGSLTAGQLGFLGPFDSAERNAADWQRFRLDRENRPYPPELAVGGTVVGGLAEEFARRLAGEGAIERPPFGYRPVNSEIAKRVLEELLGEAGVEIRYHTLLAGARRQEDGAVALTIASKRGLQEVVAQRVVDASGDGDAAAYCGAEFRQGREQDGKTQGVTLVFWIGGVTADPLALLPDAAAPYREMAAEAFRRGEFPFHPGGLGCMNYLPGMPGVVMVNLQHTFDIDGTDPEAVTLATIRGRQQIAQHLRFFQRYVPGFAHCFLLSTAAQLGVRETRRICGDATLTRRDILHGAKPADAICRFSYMIDIHLPEDEADGTNDMSLAPGDYYGIPYGALLPRGIENLLTAGRCISTDHHALASMRLMSCCMNLGEAAGAAAALSLRERCTPRALAVPLLQEHLRAAGGIL